MTDKLFRPNSSLRVDPEKRLRRDTEKARDFNQRGRESSAKAFREARREAARQSVPKRRPISPASPEQRAKATFCIVTGADKHEATVDPAHLWPRGKGGCDSDLCVVGLERSLHRRFDDGKFDLLPYLVGRHVPELQHALGHADGDLLSLLQRLTSERWVPARTSMEEEPNDE